MSKPYDDILPTPYEVLDKRGAGDRLIAEQL